MVQNRRLEILQPILNDIADGHAYFQPPSNVQMTYPCIVYKRYNANTEHADNLPYRTIKGYEVTVIDADPDSKIPDKVAALPSCVFNRHFAVDKLNHDVYTLFF